LKVTVTDLGECKKQIDVEVPVEEVKPRLKKAFKKYQSRVHIDGFRQGKVPMSMVEKRFGDAIRAEVADDMLQHYFKAAIDQESLEIVAPGAIKDFVFEEDKPFSFSSEIEVEPEVEVTDYQGLKLEKQAVKVLKKDVDQTLKMIQDQRAEQKEIKVGAKQGDFVEGDVQALNAEGVAIEGEKWEKRVFELGQPPIGQLVGDQLDGIKTGETRQFTIVMGKEETGQDEERTDQYEITATSVRKKVLPKLDDAFAKGLGEFETLDALKENVEARIKDQRQEESEKALKAELIDEIIRRNDFTLPEAMIDNVLNAMWEDAQKNPQAPTQMPEDQFKTARRPEVVWNLKWSKLWEAIAKAENIVISDEELQGEIDKVVNATGKEDKKLKAWFKDTTRRRRLQENLLEDRVVALIKESSKIKEVAKKAQ